MLPWLAVAAVFAGVAVLAVALDTISMYPDYAWLFALHHPVAVAAGLIFLATCACVFAAQVQDE